MQTNTKHATNMKHVTDATNRKICQRLSYFSLYCEKLTRDLGSQEETCNFQAHNRSYNASTVRNQMPQETGKQPMKWICQYRNVISDPRIKRVPREPGSTHNDLHTSITFPKVCELWFPMLRHFEWASAIAVSIRMLSWSSLALPNPFEIH